LTIRSFKIKKNNDDQAKQAAILQARDIAEKIAKESAELNKADKLIDDDFKRVLIAISNLFEHLNNRYKVDEKLNERVKTMTELIFDDTAYKRGEHKKAVEMAKKMLLKNKPIEEIIEFTGLTKKEILSIQKTL